MQGQNDIPQEKKRNRTWPVKFSDEEVREFEEIKRDTDRPIGYIIRELALRGLALYRRDRKLKEPESGSGGSERPATIPVRTITLDDKKAAPRKKNTA